MIDELSLVPVSISYEYDPCDLDKARELYTRATAGSYTKAPGEDDRSIAKGITGYKGRVHIAFAAPLRDASNDAKQLAQDIDKHILGNYRLFPVHYLAYAMWEGREAELNVPIASQVFDAAELAKAEAQWNKRLAACSAEEKPFLILQYANPVRNQYRIKAGLPL